MSKPRRALLRMASLPLLAGLALGLSPSGPVAVAHAATVASNPVPPSGSDASIWNGATDRSHSGATCGDYMFRVALRPGQPRQYRIFGRLCHNGPVAGKTLEVLLHGGSYDHTYWDFPYEPAKYSYVKWATGAGYVTLDLDRLGYGYSSHVDPFAASFDMQGWVVHQVIQEVREGALGAKFYKLILVGHSMGSFTTWDEAGTYHDVDGVIITGAEHHGNLVKLAQVVASIMEPAQLDPKFASQHLPLGYTTTFPGTRCGLFYYLPNTDPKVCAVDEATKSTINMGENTSFSSMMFLDAALSDAINVPVFMVDGQYDTFYCNQDCSSPADSASAEYHYYDNTPCYQAYILPNSGHDVNLEKNSTAWFAAANSWVRNRIGMSKSQPAAHSCR